jgi:hypothetical protein
MKPPARGQPVAQLFFDHRQRYLPQLDEVEALGDHFAGKNVAKHRRVLSSLMAELPDGEIVLAFVVTAH